MERLGCGSIDEMAKKVGTSLNMTGWIAYLVECERREAQKTKQLLGEQ